MTTTATAAAVLPAPTKRAYMERVYVDLRADAMAALDRFCGETALSRAAAMRLLALEGLRSRGFVSGPRKPIRRRK